MKKVAVITSYGEHYRHVVRMLQPLNPNVKFIHVYDTHVFRSYSIFDMAIEYAPQFWDRRLRCALPEIQAHLKAWKAEIRLINEIKEPFALWIEEDDSDYVKRLFDKLP